MQSIFQTENADKALKYRLYRHLPAYEKIIRNLVSFSNQKESRKNDFINDKKVSTHKSLFAIDLLEDFIVLNIPTILCTLDIAKKKRN